MNMFLTWLIWISTYPSSIPLSSKLNTETHYSLRNISCDVKVIKHDFDFLQALIIHEPIQVVSAHYALGEGSWVARGDKCSVSLFATHDPLVTLCPHNMSGTFFDEVMI